MFDNLFRSLHGLVSTRRGGAAMRPRHPRRAACRQVESLEARLVLASWVQQAELVPTAEPLDSFFGNGDQLGRSVAIDGDTAVVGASAGISISGGDESVYVFKRTGTTWTATQRLTAPGVAASRNFGFSVGISGNIIVVGAPFDGGGVGAIYIFERSDPSANFTNPRTGPHFTGSSTIGDSSIRFGESVAIDGGVIVVGAPFDDKTLLGDNAGSVQLFTRSGTDTWNAGAKHRSSDIQAGDGFGEAVAISGDTVVVGALFSDATVGFNTNQGAAYVFERTGGTTLVEQQKLVASDREPQDQFGSSVAVDGTTIVVGAPFDDQPSPAVNSIGSAYVFVDSGSGWNEQAKLIRPTPPVSGDIMGLSVAVEGDLVAVGVTGFDGANSNDGAVFLFGRTGTSWSFVDTLTHSDPGTGGDQLGNSVAIDGGSVLVGAAQHDHAGMSNSGAAYVFIDEDAVVPNQAPVNTVPGPQTIDEGLTLTFSVANGNAISTSDPDAGAADVRVTLAATNGTLSLGGTAGLAFLSGDGSDDATMTFEGTIAAINAALDGTVFTPIDDDYFGPADVSILTDDLGNTGTDGPKTDFDTVSITINPVNDAPEAASQTVFVDENGQAAITLAGSDVETAEANLTFTITSLPEAGVLTFGGVAVQIGDTFVGPPALLYEPAAGSDTTSASFTFTVTDDGDDSAPGQADETSAAATVTIDIVPAIGEGEVDLDTEGVLRIGGAAGGSTLTVDRINSTTVRVSIDGATTDFALADVSEIRIWGRDGADVIVVDTALTIDTFIDAGGGNDIVYGGGGDDIILGGDGVDLLFGNAGNDMLIGGDGFDLLVGGTGHDVLVAGNVAAQVTAAMLRDVAEDWAANRTAAEGEDDGTLDESAVDDDFDILSGGPGADWFIINLGDWVIDYRPRGANGDVITFV